MLESKEQMDVRDEKKMKICKSIIEIMKLVRLQSDISSRGWLNIECCDTD